MDVKSMILAGLAAIGTALLMGKTLRELLYQPLKYLSDRSKNKTEEIFAEAVRQDLGLPKNEDMLPPPPPEEKK